MLARHFPNYLDPSACALIEGGVSETTALLAEQWDTIFYTGNGVVGRIVARAAAEHLTPITLELGGKCPVIVDEDADLQTAARRIMWGKLINAGQTCVAPDHVLVHHKVRDELLERLCQATTAMYGIDPHASPDYGRIVNQRHFDRLAALIDADTVEATIRRGGQRDANDRYLAPTILTDVQPTAPVMQEEVFGPILPVIGVTDLEEAAQHVNRGGKPLALYAFGRDRDRIEQAIRTNSSGGVCINHVLVHLTVPGLPFGGVGESGYGSYHGQAGIDAFSHQRSVLRKRPALTSRSSTRRSRASSSG